jgi:hypothetical protein
VKCTQIKKRLKFDYPLASELHAQMTTHAQQCSDCRKELALEHLAISLVKSFARVEEEEADLANYREQRLVFRTMVRIRDLKARGPNSWTSAVISLRGWLFAFGATAALLLALSGWELLNSSTRNRAAEETSFDLTLAPSITLALDEEWDNVQR